MSDTVRTWRHIQQRYNLIGSKCTTCGELFFPSRVVCPNCRRKGNLEPFNFQEKAKFTLFQSSDQRLITLKKQLLMQ